MTDKLTKEQIEALLADAKSELAWLIAHDDERNLGTKIKSQRTNIAVLSLALEALEMRPRPLAEIDGPALVSWRFAEEPCSAIVTKYRNGKWLTQASGLEFPPETLAIPLSSLTAG